MAYWVERGLIFRQCPFFNWAEALRAVGIATAPELATDEPDKPRLFLVRGGTAEPAGDALAPTDDAGVLRWPGYRP